MKKPLLFSVLLAMIFANCQAPNKDNPRKLLMWYDVPASKWTEALPVGNGRLGAMVFGGTDLERIQLNEESVWTGGPIDRANPEALEYLPKVRQLLFEGKYYEGDQMAQEKLMGTRIERGLHTYQTLGDLFFQFEELEEISNYKRSLDLHSAMVTTTFDATGVSYRRDVFSSVPDQAIVIRLSASEKGKLRFSTYMNRPGDAESISVENNQILMQGFAQHNGKGVKFASLLSINNTGGEVISTDTSLLVHNADEVLIFLAGQTNFWGGDEIKQVERDIEKLGSKSYSEIKEAHLSDYKSLFDRVALQLNQPDTLQLPTDERLQRVKDGAVDPHLTELYFQYGRYLLISSSRPGNLPANLQGIWEATLSPPWNADYHININLQMNYWPALVTNLAECQMPFFGFVDGLRERGAVTAKDVYGCRGFVAHHTTDVWQFTDPIGKTRWGMWPMGAAWCSDHFWEHYEYTEDVTFLETKAYPVLKESALFFVDYLVKNPKTDLLVSGPGMSPENRFFDQSDEDQKLAASVCMGPAMDHQIIRELFTNCIKSAEILNTDADFADTLKTMLQFLTPSQIGSDGRILEWSEELQEVEPGHRHMSHLYALYPGEEFTNPDDPKWMEAARKSIDARLASGGGHTGWSRAWIINFFARLKDGEKAHENIQALFRKSTHPNLFDNHPPFQIDGNFGATAGIAEMLMQSHNGVLQILPALPDVWEKGKVKGLRTRGGFEVDIEWEDHALKKLTIHSLLGNTCTLLYRGKSVQLEMMEGKVYELDDGLKLF